MDGDKKTSDKKASDETSPADPPAVAPPPRHPRPYPKPKPQPKPESSESAAKSAKQPAEQPAAKPKSTSGRKPGRPPGSPHPKKIAKARSQEERERQIYDAHVCRRITQPEVGKMFGISQQAVSQIVRKVEEDKRGEFRDIRFRLKVRFTRLYEHGIDELYREWQRSKTNKERTQIKQTVATGQTTGQATGQDGNGTSTNEPAETTLTTEGQAGSVAYWREIHELGDRILEMWGGKKADENDEQAATASINVNIAVDGTTRVGIFNDPEYLEWCRQRALERTLPIERSLPAAIESHAGGNGQGNGHAGPVRSNGQSRAVDDGEAPGLPGPGDNGHD